MITHSILPSSWSLSFSHIQLFGSTFKIHPESNHFSPQVQPPTSPAGIITAVSSLVPLLAPQGLFCPGSHRDLLTPELEHDFPWLRALPPVHLTQRYRGRNKWRRTIRGVEGTQQAHMVPHHLAPTASPSPSPPFCPHSPSTQASGLPALPGTC